MKKPSSLRSRSAPVRPDGKRKKSRRLIIDVLIPNERGDRFTIKGSDKTVAPEVLDRWAETCEQIMALVAKRISKHAAEGDL